MRNDASIKRLYANRIFLVNDPRVSHVRLCTYVAHEQPMNLAWTPIDQQMDMQISSINRMIIFSRLEICVSLENTHTIPREY